MRLNKIVSLLLAAAMLTACAKPEPVPEPETSVTAPAATDSETTAVTEEEEGETMQYPQYVAMHKIDQPGYNQWYIANPSSFNEESFDEVADSIGTVGGGERRLAVAYTFSYAQFAPEDVKKSIENLLMLSESNSVPVILHLDGVNYWDYYPQLWNWWDENAPGYDPANKANVERYGVSDDTAVKLGWRNWGRQMRVRPAPNLASPAFMALQKELLTDILPVIAEWYDRLPDDKKYLLGGVVFGWELSPYVQTYYYEGGNELIGSPADNDPTGGVEKSLPLGYAAAEILGIPTENGITADTVDKICSYYMEYILGIAVECGIDPTRIVTHSFWGGKTESGGGHSGIASVSSVEGVIPGWSFYGSSIYEMDAVTALADGKPWAAIEYKSWELTHRLLNQTLNYRGCRYLNIYNWESIRDNKDTLKMLADVIDGK